jgi:hypothetical protein
MGDGLDISSRGKAGHRSSPQDIVVWIERRSRDWVEMNVCHVLSSRPSVEGADEVGPLRTWHGETSTIIAPAGSAPASRAPVATADPDGDSTERGVLGQDSQSRAEVVD